MIAVYVEETEANSYDQLGVCVCVNWGRNGRRVMDHFFSLILGNRNKRVRGEHENEMKRLFWDCLCRFPAMPFPAYSCQSFLQYHVWLGSESDFVHILPWGSSSCGQLYFSRLAQIKVDETVWLESNVIFFFFFFSFLAVRLHWWLVRKD